MLPSNPTVFFRHGRTTATLVDPVTPNTQKMTAASSFDSLQEGRVCVVQAQKRGERARGPCCCFLVGVV